MKLKLLLLATLVAAFSAFSTDYFVDASMPDDIGAATNWATAKQTIQAAVDLTVDGDTVWVTNGIYDADGAAASGYSLMNRVCVTNMITVRSVNGPKTTVIDGSGSVRGVYMIANSVLSGFTVTNGVTLATGNSTPGKDNNGGGIYAEAASCLVTNCVIAGNRTANGTYSGMFFGSNGGCSGYGAGVCGGTLVDCILISNRTGNGLSGSYSEYGDGYNGGSAGHGGGAYGSTLIQCLLFNNLTGNGGNGSAGDEGGDGGNGGNGGGAYNCTTVNCTAYGNTTGSGGNAGSSTVWGVTPVSGADGMGSGTYGGSLKNCIVWGNSSDDVQNASSVSYTCAGNVGTSNGNITSDPQFIDAANNDFQLQSSSPCINAGNNADAPAGTDLAGNPRNLGGTVDMGAYEYVPTVYYVDALQSDDSSDGTSWVTAKRTLHAAVDSTPVDGIVWVTNGTYLLSAEISITNSITIRSVNGPDVTIIDGCGSNRCFSLSGACIIGGFTITNGYSLGEYPYSGGGVYCANEQSVVSNCVISGNRAVRWGADLRCSAGGGMSGGTAIDCIFRGNKALSGGGISDGTAFNCTFIDNTAEGEVPMYSSNDCDGGGMSYGFAYNCTFTSNSSEWCCGGIAGSVAYNCDFDGNVAVYGGGGAGFVEVYGCRFFGNSARFGGGLYGGSAFNCVFVNNTASGEGGGGIHSGFSESGKIANCVFQNNDGGDFIYPLIAVHNTCSTQLTYGENGSITNVPLFVDAANGDFRLQSNSPCINWGDNSYVTNSTDLDGNPRIVEGTVDMGAYEYQGAIGLVDSDNDGINDDWERAHGGNQNPENTCSNSVNTIRQAYIAGLDPNNPTNRFQASVFRSGPGNVLRWNATSGRVYAVYYSTNLVSGFQPLETNIQWSAGCFTDTVENAAGQLFYKLEVRLEDSAENGGGSTNPFEPPPGGGDDDTPATAI